MNEQPAGSSIGSPALHPSDRFLTGRTVAVVEDHAHSRHLLRQMLA